MLPFIQKMLKIGIKLTDSHSNIHLPSNPSTPRRLKSIEGPSDYERYFCDEILDCPQGPSIGKF